MVKPINKPKILLFCFLGLVFLSTLLLVWFLKPNVSPADLPEENELFVLINNQKIFIELADTPEKRKQGLSGRELMTQDRGMLFVFPQPGLYSFWMQGMGFDLDFVFINDDKVVDIVENVSFPQPDEPPRRVRSDKESDKVLELNAGLVEKLDVKPGDQVSFFF